MPQANRPCEVESEHKERQQVQQDASEDHEHVASKECKGQENEEHEDKQEPIEVRLALVLRVACVLSIGLPPIWAEDVVPGKVQRKESWEQTQPHDEAATVNSEDVLSAAALKVGVAHGLGPLGSRSVGDLFVGFFAGVVSLLFGENWN